MTGKEKMKDPHVWMRMGRELAALSDLIAHIHSDPDYNAVMDMRTWDVLYKLTHHLNTIRGRAENRMARYVPDWSPEIFYPVEREDLRTAIKTFRSQVQGAPLEKLNNSPSGRGL